MTMSKRTDELIDEINVITARMERRGERMDTFFKGMIILNAAIIIAAIIIAAIITLLLTGLP